MSYSDVFKASKQDLKDRIQEQVRQEEKVIESKNTPAAAAKTALQTPVSGPSNSTTGQMQADSRHKLAEKLERSKPAADTYCQGHRTVSYR